MPIPEQVRPRIGWVVGMDWPEADETVLFRLADDLALAFHRINDGVRGDGRLAGGAAAGAERGDWDGEALRRFVERVGDDTASRKEELLIRLAGLALACNDLGVEVQYTKRMIKAAVLLLIFQLVWLMCLKLSPASGWAWAAAGARTQITRMMIRQLAKRLLFNVALFGTLMGGLDLYVQASQSRREEIDWERVGWSALSGVLTGVALTLTTGLLPPRSILELMGHSAVAGGGVTLATMLLSGQPIDWTMVAKGVTAGALGGADAHWASWSPRIGRAGGGDPPPPGGDPPPSAGNPGTPPRAPGGPEPTPPIRTRDGGDPIPALPPRPDPSDPAARAVPEQQTTPRAADKPPEPQTGLAAARPQPTPDRIPPTGGIDQMINWARNAEGGETPTVQLRQHDAPTTRLGREPAADLAADPAAHRVDPPATSPREPSAEPIPARTRDSGPIEDAPAVPSKQPPEPTQQTSLSRGADQPAQSGADGPGAVRTHPVSDGGSPEYAPVRSEPGNTDRTVSQADGQDSPAPAHPPREGAPRPTRPDELAVARRDTSAAGRDHVDRAHAMPSRSRPEEVSARHLLEEVPATRLREDVSTASSRRAGEEAPTARSGEDGPPPATPDLSSGQPARPDLFEPGALPTDVNARWHALTAQQQESLLVTRGPEIGALDGIPVVTRDQVNRSLVADVKAQLITERDQLNAHPRLDQNAVKRLETVNDRLEGIRAIEDRLAAPPSAEHPQLFVLRISGEGTGRVILSAGNPDTAANTAVYVPGTFTRLGANNARFIREIDAIALSATKAGSPSTAVISWMDYHAPQSLVPEAMRKGFADAAMAGLSRFLDGLRVTHEGPRSHNTVIGHSYGTVVVGHTGRDGVLNADKVLFVASPGTGVARADQLRLAGVDQQDVPNHVFAMTADHDVIRLVNWWHGRAPTSVAFGAAEIAADPGAPGPWYVFGLSKAVHDLYWESGNPALVNIGNIIANQPIY
ncbi:alpha/beta hydrolase [Nonomuraea antimicrobica]|uniref:alpha/beta hydrolase n=1 Tax=Nonomuraea antimicrobica TaxID=561173 RepID=UPI0031EF6EC0